MNLEKLLDHRLFEIGTTPLNVATLLAAAIIVLVTFWLS